MVLGSRLRFFRNRLWNITEDVSKYLQYQQGEYASIHEFLDLREVKGNQEVLASFRSFEDEEPEWVSLHKIYEAVPERVCDALHAFKDGGLARKKQLSRKFLKHRSDLRAAP